MTDARSDAELLAAHVAGDPHAFATLYERHRGRLWAVALRTCGDQEEAADGLQDGMISAFRSASSFRGDAAVTTWLHRIVVNACLDRLRRRKSRATVPLPTDAWEDARDTLADPRDHAGQTELAIDLQRVLLQLPDEQRVPIVLVDVEGMRVDEVARMLGIPTGTVKSRCARGRAKLAAMLRPLDPQSGNPHGEPGVPPSTRAGGQAGGDSRP